MSKLTSEMVERRLHQVASSTFVPEIPGLPGLEFHKLTLADRGRASRAYAAKLKELNAAGGYYNEALIPTVLERVCRENGLDMAATLRQAKASQQRFYDSMPKEFTLPFDQLTEEEVALLSPEEREEREQAIVERGRRILEWQQQFYTADDRRVVKESQQIEALEAHLLANTVEHQARIYQMCEEILCCACTEDAKPYFDSVDEILGLADQSEQLLATLWLKWRQWKAGAAPQFFRPDHPPVA